MTANPLIKCVNHADGNGRGDLHWHRAGIDGAPFRSRGPYPMLTEEEYEEYVVRVCDVRNGTFDLTDPEQNRNYLNVLEGIANGWFEKVHIERCIDLEKGVRLAYVEWKQYFMEDGRPAKAPEAGHGRPYGDGAPA